MLKFTRKTYGNTWWGQAWIQALEKIDSNRLSRGKTYANTGRVLSISIKEGKISARVKGSYYDLYTIEIKVSPFTRKDIQSIQSLITTRPSLSIELATGKLPPNLLALLEETDIKLLPENWEDLQSQCSCPDSANPCKHLAAVYYLIAHEIDKNPFLLFSFKGMPIATLTHQTGGEKTTPRQNSPLDHFSPSAQTQPVPEFPVLTNFNYVFPLRDIRPLLSLLSDNPPFYIEGNFKTFLEKLYQTVPDATERLFSEVLNNAALSELAFQLELFKDPYSQRYLSQWKILSNPNDTVKKEEIRAALNSQSPHPQEKRQLSTQPIKLHKDHALLLQQDDKGTAKPERLWALAITPPDTVFNYLIAAPLALDTDRLSPSFAFLKILATTALGLVKARLFLPEVVHETESAFIIRYSPNTQEVSVQKTIEQLRAVMPLDICHAGEQFLQPDGVADLLALFITYLVHQACKYQTFTKKHKVLTVFTQNVVFQPKQFSERSVAESITNWLERLHIGKRTIAPQIRFEIGENETFQVYVDVINRKNTLDPMVPFDRLFSAPSASGQSKKRTLFSLPVEDVQIDVSRQLIIAAQYMDELRLIVDSQGKVTPAITVARMSEILLNTAGVLDVMGIGLILPKELARLAYPDLQAKAKLRDANETGVSYLSLEGMLDFSYEIALGEEAISPEAFQKLVRQSGGLVKFKEQYVLLEPEAVQQILHKLQKPFAEITSPMQILYAAFSGKVNGLSFQPDQALQRVLSDMTQSDDVITPDNLNATLRPYQERGFQWLWSNSQKGFGSCIADDMGLGKTIQVITVLLQAQREGKNTNPSLVICPTTLIGNWEKECRRFAPSLNLNIYHGNERQLRSQGVDLLITSYGTFRRDFKKFSAKEWQFLIIDEAQNIKNSNTAQTQAVKALKAANRIAMTGTPVENKLTELWNIFDFINPGYLGSLTQFKNQLANPIEKYQDPEVVTQFKKATAPFILRRLKTDKSIISDLPDKVTLDEYCYLTKEQAAVYQSVVETILREIESTDGIQRKGLIFKLISSLKQICNHPTHFANKGNISSELSGKAAKTISILRTILENKEKALIFTQYREMGHLLQRMIQDELGQEPLFFHGGILRKKRDEMVHTFQSDPKTRLMIISLKAGGTGLNLTEASNVIHYDLWWNPAVENQATDRAYRIGQDKKVMVYRLITLGTFEEKIDDMLKAKKALADLTVTNSEQGLTEMSTQALREIFSLFQP